MTNEPSEEESVAILRGLRPAYEAHHQVSISDEAVEAAVKMSVRYINDRFLPDKAIDLIDEASAKVKLSSMSLSGELQNLTKQMETLDEAKEAAIISGDLNRASEIGKEQKLLSAEIASMQRSVERRNKKKVVVQERDIADVVSSLSLIHI